MQKGICHGLHRKFFRSRVLHLPGNNYAWVCAKSLQLCPTLRPYGLKPARLLCPWDSPGKNTGVVAMPSSRESSQLRDGTCISCVSYIGRWILYLLYHCTTWCIFSYSLIYKPYLCFTYLVFRFSCL